MMRITRTGSPGSLIIIGLIFFICGALMMFSHFKQSGFKQITGTVVSSDIVKKIETQSESTTSSTSWYLLVEYEYTVEGQTYQNDNISSAIPMSDAGLGQAPSKKLVALSKKFVPGETVTVYVSPRNPNKTILLHAPNYGIWGVLIGFIFFAGAFYWSRLRAGG
ncbi:DUF3592 domain-containing protein [Hellea sp.]|nr:DUF3592 domain-containing protein [Hellea sp.]